MFNNFLSLLEKHSYVKNKTSNQCYLKKRDVVLIKKIIRYSTVKLEKSSYWKTNYWQRQKRQECFSSSNIRKIDKNRPLQLLISRELLTSENVQIMEKDKNKRLQSIIEKYCYITPNENIVNRRSRRLVARNANLMNNLMFEQWDIEI